MKMNDDDAPLDVQARRALDLALAGRDLEVGPTARERLLSFAANAVGKSGFSGAYAAVGDLLSRPEVVRSISDDNSKDVGTPQVVDNPTPRTLSQLFAAAKAGDAGALYELNSKTAVVR